MKEEIMSVIDENFIIADKISRIEHDFKYDSEKENKLKNSDKQSIEHAEIITKENENIFDDFEDLFQI